MFNMVKFWNREVIVKYWNFDRIKLFLKNKRIKSFKVSRYKIHLLNAITVQIVHYEVIVYTRVS